jgi:uncharacterized protein with beta-barrel porin domain
MKHLLLASTALICVGVCGQSAMAACSNTTPANSETVVCKGTSSTAVNGSASTGVTVNVNNGAVLALTNGHAIDLGGHGTVNLFGSGQIALSHGDTAGIVLTGNNGAATLNDTSHLVSSGGGQGGTTNIGISVTGNSNSVSLRDATTLSSTAGGGGSAAVRGILANGNGNTVTLSDLATVNVTTGGGGSGSIFGIYVVGTDNVVTLNNHAHILSHSDGGSSNQIAGIYVKGNHGVVTIGADSVVDAAGGNAILLANGSNTLVNHGALIGEGATAIVGDNNVLNSDTIFNDGLITGAGTAISLGAGDDTLTLGTGSHIIGLVDGGAGIDHLTLTGSGSADNQFVNFEDFVMNGHDWSLSGNSTFQSIDVQNGRLAVNGVLTGTSNANVQQNGILGGSGTLIADVTSTGTIAPGNSVGTLTIQNHSFQQINGAFDTEFDQHGIDKLNVIGAGAIATLINGPTLNLIPVGGAAGANGVILHADSGITGSFGRVNFLGNGAATITQTANDISVTTVDGTAVEGTAMAASQAGLDFLDAVDGETAVDDPFCADDHNKRCRHLWAKAFGHFGSEDASDGNRPFDYRIAGTAMGGDMPVAPGLRLGASFGYSNTDETLTHDAASADINTTQAAFYAKYQTGRFFVTGQLSGGWQHLDLSRNLGGSQSANANTNTNTNGWLFGSSLQAGATFAFPQGWRLTPSLGAAYQHQWVDGYGEHGGGNSDVRINSHQSDALRLRAQLVLNQDYQLADMTLTPHVKVGALEQLNLGGHADGSFAVDGSDFSLSLNDRSRLAGLVGLGLAASFNNGLTTYVDYDGTLSAQGTVHAVTGGLRYDW